MNENSVPIPKEVFSDLDLQDGDVIEGRARNAWVDVRILRRGRDEGAPLTAERFVEKWRGQFPNVVAGSAPRLDAFLNKHVKPG